MAKRKKRPTLDELREQAAAIEASHDYRLDQPEVAPCVLLTCSFCNKSQNDVSRLIAGPCVYICNECILLCVEILVDWPQSHSNEQDGG